MTFHDAPALASISGGSLLAVGLVAAAASGLVAALRPRPPRSTSALPPLPQQWDHDLVISAPRAGDLVRSARRHTP